MLEKCFKDKEVVRVVIILFFKFLCELASFACTGILCSLSSKDPLEAHFFGDLNNYFYDVENIQTLNIENSKSNNDIINQIRIKESIFNGYKNVSSEEDNKKKIL